MTATAVASVAAATGLAAYLNGKYHLGTDIQRLRFKSKAAKYYAELGEASRLISISETNQNSPYETPISLVFIC